MVPTEEPRLLSLSTLQMKAYTYPHISYCIGEVIRAQLLYSTYTLALSYCTLPWVHGSGKDRAAPLPLEHALPLAHLARREVVVLH